MSRHGDVLSDRKENCVAQRHYRGILGYTRKVRPAVTFQVAEARAFLNSGFLDVTL